MANEIGKADVAEALREHYQKTYELTYELWQERNRSFLVLLGVIAVGALLIFGGSGTNSLLVYWSAKLLGITDPNQVNDIQRSFPFGLVQLALFGVVFYLMMSLYHRTVYILRNYSYLADLEKEIREYLGLPADHIAFTREGDYYWQNQPKLLGSVKWVYIAILAVLLVAFLGGRTYGDLRAGNAVLVVLDVALTIPIALYYLAYAYVSVRNGSQEPRANPPPHAKAGRIGQGAGRR